MVASLWSLSQGRTIPTQESPHRRSVLRKATANIGTTNNWDQLAGYLMRAFPEPHEFAAVPADCRWAPTPRMVAYWEAIQAAKRRGLSGRAIARELGISRNTVRKYSMASQLPVHHGRRLRPTQEEVLTFSLDSNIERLAFQLSRTEGAFDGRSVGARFVALRSSGRVVSSRRRRPQARMQWLLRHQEHPEEGSAPH